jgi:hypothetical protein
MKKLLFSASLLLIMLLSASGLQAQNVYTSETSGPNNCDGYAWLADSSSVNETTISWAGGGTILQQGGFYIDNLCPGTYTLTYTDAFLGNVTYTFVIGYNPCYGFTVTYATTEPSAPVICDGAITVAVSGGTAPYTYFWSAGSTSPGMTDLCAGSYDCVVTDANGCVASVYVDLGGINSNDSILVIDNTTYPDSLVLDTLGNTWIEDCIIDFLSIDSAYVGGIANVAADTILLNWILVDTNGLVVLDLLVPYVNPNGVAGVYQVSMTIFCPQKASGINTMIANDQVYFESMSLGIMEENHNLFTVSNPFNESIQVTFVEAGNYTVELMDLNGKILSSINTRDSKEAQFSSSDLKSGMYSLNVQSESGRSSKKILKL